MVRKPYLIAAVAVAVGVALGWLGARPLEALSWGNLLVWAAANVGLGLYPGTKGAKVARLALFGFSLGLSFMLFGYTGSDSVATRLLPFSLVGLFCAACAVALGAVVHLIRSASRSASG